MLVSYVAGQGVELTVSVNRKSVVVEEIKEVELRSRRAQFIYDRNYNRIGLQPRGHVPSRLSVKKLRRLLLKKRKVRVFVWKGIRKNIISYYSSAFTINPQAQRRGVPSHSDPTLCLLYSIPLNRSKPDCSIWLTTWLGGCHKLVYSGFPIPFPESEFFHLV